jgi:hypothetical protein
VHAGRRSEQRIRTELAYYLQDKQRWPTQAQFKADGRSPFRRAIARSGGLNRWTKEHPDLRCPHAFRWTDEYIHERLLAFCQGRTTLPSEGEFLRAGERKLDRAISTHHGRAWWAPNSASPTSQTDTSQFKAR